LDHWSRFFPAEPTPVTSLTAVWRVGIVAGKEQEASTPFNYYYFYYYYYYYYYYYKLNLL